MCRCEHGREKRRCRECGGSGICKHNHVKFTCKQCNAGLPSGAKLYVHIRGSQGEFGPLELGSRRVYGLSGSGTSESLWKR